MQNLSLYSDGLADNKYTSQEDGKVSVYYGENPITKGIDINTRIMIENRLTFRMTNINDYEYRANHNGQCAIKSMLLQTTVLDKDDLENNIAWNDGCEVENVDKTSFKIVGDKKAMLGSKKIYDCSQEVYNKHWEIECSPELRQVIKFETLSDEHCEIKFPTSARFVGESIKLKMFISNALIDTLDITIKSI